jgi:Lipid A core - O-antigen ligase and related enzymes
MNSLKPWQWAGILLALGLAIYFVYFHLQSFGDVSFLGAILLLEIIVIGLWKYDQRFFALLIITFLWAGMHIPMQSAGILGRWVVLAAGALVGLVIWIKAPRKTFHSIHLVSLFCIIMAFVSATVSQYVQMAGLKAASLTLLFLYCVSGARLAAIGREDRFFRSLILGSELIVGLSALCYFGLGYRLWGNPNSLGAALGIGAFPILLWGWLTTDGQIAKLRRLAALLVCAYLIRFSISRAAMISTAIVTVVFCLCLHRYKLLVKIVAIVLFLIAASGMMAPEKLNKQLSDLKDDFLYKGHTAEGIMGSRLGPWEQSIKSIKQHPWFGTGYGTSPTGEDPGIGFGRINSSAETEREHGSSYITIAEWVGLVGVLPFIALLIMTLTNVWKVCRLMNRTSEVRYYSIPLAMVVLSGFVHASFEDWMFAVGSYLSLFFWVCAFVLADLVPSPDAVPAPAQSFHPRRVLPTDYEVNVSHR